MKTGMTGYKGRIHYHCSECIDGFLDALDNDIPKGELYTIVAQYIDREIHKHYCLYPVNYLSLDILNHSAEHNTQYGDADKAQFEHYIEAQTNKITIENKDEDYLRERILTMYANPARNYLEAK